MAPSSMSGPTPTPPAGVPRAVSGRSPSVSSDDALAATVAPSQSAQLAAQVRAASAQRPVPRNTDVSPRDTFREEAWGNLVTVNRDGSDGQRLVLAGDQFDIGRTEGQLTFADDVYLASRHGRFLQVDGQVVLRPLDTVNGVFLKVVSSVDLVAGDQILIGKELLRYEPLTPEEREPPSLVEHGVRLFGSAPREAWGRLRQLTVAGTTRDIWHLVRPELVVGREEGDVTFPDDEFMSRRHAAVRKSGTKARLEDLRSSNGTFIRLRGDHPLASGEVFRMGDQLMRFEAR
jgi:pSer/pThr/pTyr-binding forkhead associated (FHA) protein